ncbi:hypothetical protein PROFUN_07633 [Planoprotostelium fungivorum]|uniref:AP complex mu/sigma subunit domain-containing protein n=1 Tax=Planoprotostelium fungivorum TaxID=1890364 RepID=A0A2P6NK69_9EUKA|nr:hypothetical protein PROFUN_07633 [Planoprotostelium fungivorum]
MATFSIESRQLERKDDEGAPSYLKRNVSEINRSEEKTFRDYNSKKLSIVVLDGNGKRLCAHYYTDEFPTTKEQLAFESTLFTKTKKVLMWNNTISAYRSCNDTYFYVSAGYEENELMLTSVLNTLIETMQKLLRNEVDSRSLLENLDYLILAVDEIIDQGIVLESDPSVIASRVSMKGGEAETPIGDLTLSEALSTAKNQFFHLVQAVPLKQGDLCNASFRNNSLHHSKEGSVHFTQDLYSNAFEMEELKYSLTAVTDHVKCSIDRETIQKEELLKPGTHTKKGFGSFLKPAWGKVPGPLVESTSHEGKRGGGGR